MKDNILNRVIKKYRSEIDIDIEGKLRYFFLSELENSGDNGYAILDDKKLLSTLYPYSPTRENLVQGIDDENIKNTLICNKDRRTIPSFTTEITESLPPNEK